MSYCRTSGGRAGKMANSASRSCSLFILLSSVCFINLLSPTLANEKKIFDNQRAKLYDQLTEKTMSKCLKPLESSSRFILSLRMYVRPLGPGSNNLHMAGKVDVQDDMPVGSGWSRFRYQYTSLAKELTLKVWVNDTELPFKASRNLYIQRYEFYNVNIYMQGRMEVYDGDECPPPASTTDNGAESPSTTSMLNPTTPNLKEAKEATIPESPKSPTNNPTTNPEPKPATSSGILATKSASILVTVGVVAVILIPAIVFLVWRCRNLRKEETRHPFGGEQHIQLMHHPNARKDEYSAVPQKSQISGSVTRNNPLYTSPSPSVNAASPSTY